MILGTILNLRIFCLEKQIYCKRHINKQNPNIMKQNVDFSLVCKDREKKHYSIVINIIWTG